MVEEREGFRFVRVKVTHDVQSRVELVIPQLLIQDVLLDLLHSLRSVILNVLAHVHDLLAFLLFDSLHLDLFENFLELGALHQFQVRFPIDGVFGGLQAHQVLNYLVLGKGVLDDPFYDLFGVQLWGCLLRSHSVTIRCFSPFHQVYLRLCCWGDWLAKTQQRLVGCRL